MLVEEKGGLVVFGGTKSKRGKREEGAGVMIV